MDLEKILKEITSGLTGDNEKDIQYLKEQSEKYKEHELQVYNNGTLQCPVVIGKEKIYDNGHKFTRAKRKNNRLVLPSFPRR